MPIDRPKILTRFTVPTGGWTLTTQVSEGGQFDYTVSCTIAAGDYYMADDGQADDFLFELTNKYNVAIDNEGPTDWVGRSEGMLAWIDSNHKVHLAFSGTWFKDFANAHRDVRIDWTTGDGASIGNVLGFDTSANLELTGVDEPEATADSHHAYGWYADTDGQLESLGIEPGDEPSFSQSFGPGGHSKVQYIGSQLINEMRLAFMPRLKTWSGNVGYTTDGAYPYATNVPLQCWWQEARQGVEFRVYRQSVIDTTKANEAGVRTGHTATTLTDSGKAWTVNQWAGRLFYSDHWQAVNDDNTNAPKRAYVVSNTATVLTVNAMEPANISVGGSTTTYYLFDQTYKTYVLDLDAMGGFHPTERPNIDKFDLTLPLVRFET